jgi:hypothetical protein
MSFIPSTLELIINLWQLKTVVSMHWCLLCAPPLVNMCMLPCNARASKPAYFAMGIEYSHNIDHFTKLRFLISIKIIFITIFKHFFVFLWEAMGGTHWYIIFNNYSQLHIPVTLVFPGHDINYGLRSFLTLTHVWRV